MAFERTQPIPSSEAEQVTTIIELQNREMATIGALTILREAIDFSGQTDELKNRRIKEDYLLMSKLLHESYVFYADRGKTDIFFGFNGHHPEDEPFLTDVELFQALADGARQQEKDRRSEEKKAHSFVIAVVGRNNSGKDLVALYLEEKYGIPTLALSDQVKNIAAAYGHNPPWNRDILDPIGNKVRDTYDSGILIRAALRLQEGPGTINGPRKKKELDSILKLQEKGTNVIIVSIEGEIGEQDLRTRFLRALKRGSPKDPKNDTPEEFEQFKTQDAREADGIEDARQLATDHIYNPDRTPFQEIYEQTDAIMKKYGIEPLESEKDNT